MIWYGPPGDLCPYCERLTMTHHSYQGPPFDDIPDPVGVYQQDHHTCLFCGYQELRGPLKETNR